MLCHFVHPSLKAPGSWPAGGGPRAARTIPKVRGAATEGRVSLRLRHSRNADGCFITPPPTNRWPATVRFHSGCVSLVATGTARPSRDSVSNHKTASIASIAISCLVGMQRGTAPGGMHQWHNLLRRPLHRIWDPYHLEWRRTMFASVSVALPSLLLRQARRHRSPAAIPSRLALAVELLLTFSCFSRSRLGPLVSSWHDTTALLFLFPDGHRIFRTRKGPTECPIAIRVSQPGRRKTAQLLQAGSRFR